MAKNVMFLHQEIRFVIPEESKHNLYIKSSQENMNFKLINF